MGGRDEASEAEVWADNPGDTDDLYNQLRGMPGITVRAVMTTGEPGEQGLFLNGVPSIGQLREILLGQVVTSGGHNMDCIWFFLDSRRALEQIRAYSLAGRILQCPSRFNVRVAPRP